jgi:signal peptide peptidase SppA
MLDIIHNMNAINNINATKDIIILLKEDLSVGHAVSIFAANCSIVLGFLLCLMYCSNKIFKGIKKIDTDEIYTEEGRFKIVKREKINAQDSALFKTTFCEKNTYNDKNPQPQSITVSDCATESKDEEQGINPVTSFVKLETPPLPTTAKKPIFDCAFKPFKCCCRKKNKSEDIGVGNDLPKKHIKKYIMYKFNNLNDEKKGLNMGLISSSGNRTDPFNNLEIFVNIVLKTCNSKNTEILLHISSPGGVAYKFEKLYTSVKRLSDVGFKITALIDDICASGGYMLACACDKIVCSKYSQIGSVGVIAEVVNYHELSKKVGLDIKTFKTGKYKDGFPSGEPYTDEDIDKMNMMMFDTLEVFSDIVKSARGFSVEQMEEILSAKVWYGTKALEKKLIDEISLSEDYLNKLESDGEIFIIVPKNDKAKTSLLSTIMNSSYVSNITTLLGGTIPSQASKFDKIKME